MTLPMRRQRVFVEIESTPGVAETLVAADGAWFQQNTSIETNVQEFEVEPYHDALGTDPSTVGVVQGNIRTTTHLVGSGSLSTPPPFSKPLRGCGWQETTGLVRLTIGAITGGPFTIDETVTGGTSGATASVCMTTRTGVTLLYVYGDSGTFTTETITGGTSGATATVSAVTDPGGTMYRPRSNGFETMTVGHYSPPSSGSNSLVRQLTYSVGNSVFRFESGNRCFLDFDFQGRMSVADQANLSAAAEVSTQPATWAQANALTLLDGYAACLQNMEWDIGNEIESEPCANNATGLDETLIVSRAPTGSVDPRLELVATHDYFNKHFDATTGDIMSTIGSTDGNRFFLHAPKAQYASIGGGDRAGKQTADISLRFHRTGSGNNEMVLVCG